MKCHWLAKRCHWLRPVCLLRPKFFLWELVQTRQLCLNFIVHLYRSMYYFDGFAWVATHTRHCLFVEAYLGWSHLSIVYSNFCDVITTLHSWFFFAMLFHKQLLATICHVVTFIFIYFETVKVSSTYARSGIPHRHIRPIQLCSSGMV